MGQNDRNVDISLCKESDGHFLFDLALMIEKMLEVCSSCTVRCSML